MAGAAAAALAKVGVTLLVDELDKFVSDMRKSDDAIKKLGPSGTLVGRALSGLAGIVSGILDSAFKTVTGTISGVFMSALRTVEYAIGTLLADAIRAAVGLLKDLVAGSIESADEFARMEMRLQRLNFNDLRDSGMEYADAMEKATEMTKEQLDWALRLSLQTPFTPQDYASIFTLAKVYSFTADEAKNLTEAIFEFTAGMGLTNVEAQRIVINFGQMRQQGKLNGQDLKDLGRGAFVPINRLLAETADLLGYSSGEFAKLRKKGELGAEGVDAFVQSFQKMARQDFQGAGKELGKVFSAATANLKGLIQSMLGIEIVKPILLMIGDYIFRFTGALAASDEMWDKLKNSLERISGVILRVVASFILLMPTAEEMAAGVLDGLEGIADWFEDNEDMFVAWVQDAVKWVEGVLVPAIESLWVWLFGTDTEQGAIQKFGAWISDTMIPFIKDEAIPAIEELWKWLFGDGQTAETVNPLEGALHQPMEESPSQDQGAVREFINWITNEFIPRIQEAGQAIATHLLPFLQDDLLPVFQELVPLGEAIADVFLAAMGVDPNTDLSTWIHEELIPAIQELTKWTEENKDMLALLFKAFVALQIIIFITSLISAFVGWLVAGTVSVIGFIAKLSFAIGVLAIVGLAIGAVILIFKILQYTLELVKGQFKAWVDFFVAQFMGWKENLTRIIKEVSDALTNGDWWGAGRAIVDGVWRGINSGWNNVVNLAKDLANAARIAFESIFKTQSPSKVMYDIGENIVKGLAAGISRTSDLAVKSMQSMAGAVMTPAMQTAQMSMSAMPNSVSNTTYNRTAILNLTTNAKSEPIIQDFAMLESMT